jgi:hypothetical protein
MIDLSRLTLLPRGPYPVGSATAVLQDFKPLADAFPPERLFRTLGGGYKKLSLSERNNADHYRAFLASSPAWHRFHAHIKHEFIADALTRLVGLGALAESALVGHTFTARFEFSSLPADGGVLRPHTDIPSKIVTVVIGMDRPSEWDPAWGGGTDILRPRDPHATLLDYQAPLSAFDVVHTFAHESNEAVVFVKTEDSWHSVGPIAGPAGHYRRTLTINIERGDRR